MAVCEKYAARRIRDSESPTAETTWLIWDDPDSAVADETAAYAALLAAPLPLSYTFPSGKTADVTGIALNETGDKNWEAVVSYSVFVPKEDNDIEFQFEISLQDVTITHATSTTAYTGGGRTAPDFSGGVNISADGKVQGVSNGQPKFSFSVTKYWPIAAITPGYMANVKALAGRYNDASFTVGTWTFPAGEIKFAGSSGKPQGNKWPISYRFEHSDNETGISVGDITVTSRLGWQYLDVYRRTISDATSKKKVEVPHSVYVHDLPPGPGNLNLLAI